MIDNDKIEIELSKSKIFKLLLISVIFILLGLWMIITNPQTSNPLFGNPIVKTFASYGTVIMGLLGMFFFTKKLFDKKSGLIIDENGVFDNSSAVNLGQIPWSDISEIYEYNMQVSAFSKQYFIKVAISNPDKYYSQIKNPIKRKLFLLNSKKNGLELSISTNGLKINHKELLEIMLKAFDKYKV